MNVAAQCKCLVTKLNIFCALNLELAKCQLTPLDGSIAKTIAWKKLGSSAVDASYCNDFILGSSVFVF